MVVDTPLGMYMYECTSPVAEATYRAQDKKLPARHAQVDLPYQHKKSHYACRYDKTVKEQGGDRHPVRHQRNGKERQKPEGNGREQSEEYTFCVIGL